MVVGKITSIVMAIVVVAGVTVAVSHPASVGLINASGNAFSGALKAAEGR